MIDVNSVDELIDIIKKNGIAVYGTGYVAEHFIQSLQLKELGQCISFCVVTSKKEDTFMDYDVIELDKLRDRLRKEVVCVAVHESIKDEIVNALIKKGINDYIWIYPFQHALRFGNPCQYDKKIDLKKIIANTKDDYRIAIRIAAIKQYYGENDCGYSIYTKAQQLHCDKHTARMRLERFILLIDNWEKNGFCNDDRPQITKKYEILDGVHRIALAIYHEMQQISCDIYDVNNVSGYRNEYIDVKRGVIPSAGLSEKEKKELDNIHSKYVIKGEDE
ncbi:hypothetical protein SAMN02745247_00643 [Butyrivibrio hungatei DSM 14810]|uniref:Uncharacterized protein n=1 Tax=Butyrivibrio hungatei DSM 14810 TaxID=1121132 RepID=A0A1M7RY80_9FIRM|nr:hypothetical protein [Butyrivibrio hungatei]SHN51094.1 hypothetical protein SAMN02745247_00643 [Butyrivibrio hungatei DSM 14810]